jgi:hypothetical protein
MKPDDPATVLLESTGTPKRIIGAALAISYGCPVPLTATICPLFTPTTGIDRAALAVGL